MQYSTVYCTAPQLRAVHFLSLPWEVSHQLIPTSPSPGVGILYKKSKPDPPNLFSFIQPFSMDVWIYMTTAYLGASLTMFLLAR